MNSKFALIVVGILIVVSMAVTADLGMRRPQEILDAEKAELEEFACSILDWETIVSVVPKVAGYEMDESTSIRGKPSPVTITSDSPVIWRCSREVSEDGVDVPGGFHCFEVLISFWESEAAVREETERNSEWGFEIQEDQVTTGFFEEKAPFGDGRDRNVLQAFAAKGRLRVRLSVITYFDGSEGEPFAGRAELERLIELVKERLINIGTVF
jgi:hypothetical protein